MLRLARALLLGAAFCACSRESSSTPPQRLEKYVLDHAPADVGTKMDVSFDDKVTLIGARVKASASQLSYGDKVTLVLYWRSDAPVDENVRLSTHLLDGAGKEIVELDYVGSLRQREDQSQVLGPGRWRPGNFYIDLASFKIPSAKQLKTTDLEVVVSLANGEERLPVVRGAHDAQNRVKVAAFTVTPRPPRPDTTSTASTAPAAAGSATAGSAPAGSGAPSGSGAPAAPAVPKK